jgi:hypothetical protein
MFDEFTTEDKCALCLKLKNPNAPAAHREGADWNKRG